MDFVLYRGRGFYTGPAYVDEDWIVANFDNWGGMKNRWPPTRRLYVWKLLTVPPRETQSRSAKRELTPALDTFYAVRLLGILESIEAREEWDAMIRAIKLESAEVKKEWTEVFEDYNIMPARGYLWALQVSFESLLGDRALAARIGRLEQRWGAALTERPGRR